MKVRRLTAFFLLATMCQAQAPAASSPLQFTSSIPWLNTSFSWAKQQALEYTKSSPETIGPWYEAALPGRNSFCMRDVSHQTAGAAALGLSASNRNMLKLFASSMAESRDWAAYWEIDGDGKPSSADYVSDEDFWFNLPANFDVLDASMRMSQWTGDHTYLNDPVFTRFYRKTMTSYIDAWQLGASSILNRPRIANQRLKTGKFVQSRGIPSYTEGSVDFIVGADLLAAEFRALQSFASLSTDKTLIEKGHSEASRIQGILERVGWSDAENHYLGTIHKDLTGAGSGDTLVLYFEAAKPGPHTTAALDYISAPKYWQAINIEEESYIPQTLFRYGRRESAYRVLADISREGKARREYPEVSYSVVAAIVNGVMGIDAGPGAKGIDVTSLSQLPADSDVASVSNLSIKSALIDLSHRGYSKSALTNHSSKTLHWRAEFPGSMKSLKLDNRELAARQETLPGGRTISWVDVTVPPGHKVEVSQ